MVRPAINILCFSKYIADESKLSEQLLFWESVALSDEKRRAAKALVLKGDKRVHAAMMAYRSSNSLPLLEETVDLILV